MHHTFFSLSMRSLLEIAWFPLLPPANKVRGTVIFSEACVKNSVHRGAVLGRYPQGMYPPAGTPPGQVHPQQVHPLAGTLPRQVHPWQVHPLAGTPPGRYTPLGQIHPPAGTPPGQVHPLGRYPLGRHTYQAGTPLAGTPPGQVHPPGRYTPRQVHPLGRYTPLGRYSPNSYSPPQVHPPQCMLGYSQQAGGTHPTGIHFLVLLSFETIFWLFIMYRFEGLSYIWHRTRRVPNFVRDLSFLSSYCLEMIWRHTPTAKVWQTNRQTDRTIYL